MKKLSIEQLLKVSFRDILMILLGSAIVAFGFVAFNMENNLAQGGVTGVALIVNHFLKIDPAYTTLAINIPLFLWGRKALSNKTMIYTLLGTGSLSAFLWIFQRIPMNIDTGGDLLVSALLSGLVGGFGSGLVYRAGGTTGGTDILAKMWESKYGIKMAQSLLILDVVVLAGSLSYITLKEMVYTLVGSFISSRVIESVQSSAYLAKGLLVMSNKIEEIAEVIMGQMDRGVTYFYGEGGYEQVDKRILYCVISPREVAAAKRIIDAVDEKAFISILDVHEVHGEGFTFMRKQRRLLG